MSRIKKALEIAKKVHRGQLRHKGENKEEVPYITHPIGIAEMVAQITNDEELICAAYLHDTIEDIAKNKPNNAEALDNLKKEIKSLSPNTLKYVEELSHDKSKEDYQTYVKRISNDKKLRIIKICDMIYNVTENPNEKQKEKYRIGLMILFKSLSKLKDSEEDVDGSKGILL